MENDEELILRECREISEAMVRGDTDLLRRLVAAENVQHVSGMIQPTAEWLQDLEEGNVKYFQISCEDPKIKVTGKEAVLTCRSLLEASVYGVKGNWQFPVQMSFQKQNGKWNAVNMNYVANERKGA